MIKFRNAILISILFSLIGCSNIRTRDAYKESLLENVQNRNFLGAIKIIEDTKEKSFSDKDRVLYYLYKGVLLHYNQEYQESNIALTDAENAIEDLYTKSLSRAASSMLLNDNVFAYAGEDYEDIYINIFKALNYMNLNQSESAFVEVRKVNIKLNLLEDKYKKYADELNDSDDSKIKVNVKSIQFNNSALARFLGMLLYRADKQFDDVRIDHRYLDEAFQLQAHIYNFSKPDLSGFVDIKAGNTKLNFVSFTGLAPEKHPLTYRVATAENMVIVFVDDGKEADGQQFIFPGVSAGNYFKFSIPRMKEKKSEISKITIEVNDKKIGELAKIEDINNIAKETFQIKANMTYIRAITRTVIKGIASIMAQKEMEKRTGELGGFLTKLGAAALTEASEAADLRSCFIFPGFAYIGDYDIAPGNYNIKVNYIDRYNVLVYTDYFNDYEVKGNEINLIESYYLK